jgi:hypothetical protein
MSEVKHTPGPWDIEYVGDKPPNHNPSDQPTIAYVGDYRVIGPGRGYDLHGECIDDARVIASSPDMLAALKLALPQLPLPIDAEDTSVSAVAHRAVEGAIAKAEGRSS